MPFWILCVCVCAFKWTQIYRNPESRISSKDTARCGFNCEHITLLIIAFVWTMRLDTLYFHWLSSSCYHHENVYYSIAFLAVLLLNERNSWPNSLQYFDSAKINRKLFSSFQMLVWIQNCWIYLYNYKGEPAPWIEINSSSFTWVDWQKIGIRPGTPMLIH